MFQFQFFLLQNRTNSDQLDDDDDETVCKNDCHVKQVRIVYKISHLTLNQNNDFNIFHEDHFNVDVF